ncbi:MAG: PH domain-containing protein [Acidobacteriota bacterium]
MPETTAPKPGAPLSRRIPRVALLVFVLALLVFGGILVLYNRPFSSSPPTLTASRLTVGNRLFPVQVAVFPERVALHKPRFFGHTEDSLSIDQIASVKIQASVVFADVVLDTTGGSPPLVIHGLFKKDAETLRERISAARENRRKPPA